MLEIKIQKQKHCSGYNMLKVYKDDLLIVNDDNLTILVDNIKIRLDVIDNKVRIFSITKNNSKIDYEVY